MADNNLAKFAQTPKTVTAVTTLSCVIGTADAPTNTALLMTAGAEGAILTRLSAMPRATVGPASLLLFTSSDAGVTMRLKDSETMASQTVSTTAGIAETVFFNYSETTPLRLGANVSLHVGSQVALAAGIVFSGEVTGFE